MICYRMLEFNQRGGDLIGWLAYCQWSIASHWAMSATTGSASTFPSSLRVRRALAPSQKQCDIFLPDFHMCKGQEYVKVPESEIFVAPD